MGELEKICTYKPCKYCVHRQKEVMCEDGEVYNICGNSNSHNWQKEIDDSDSCKFYHPNEVVSRAIEIFHMTEKMSKKRK